LATSYTLSMAIRQLNPDLIICGKQSADGDTAQTGPSLAEMLKISQITNVLKINDVGGNISCHTRTGSVSVDLPALITVEKFANLRFPSVRAKTKDVEIWDAKKIGADIEKCGTNGSPTKVLKTYENSVGGRKCKFIYPNELMEIINVEREKRSTKLEYVPSAKRFDEVWVIGEELEKIARSIGKNIKVLPKQRVEKIVDFASKHNPKVILWPGDLWGRANAPRAAVLLKTGLCADCTHLETDGDRLYMYRPTYSGNLMAKIKCSTNPQMATVRVSKPDNKDVVIAGGKGVKGDFDLIKAFAKKIGADVGASRGLVDMGIAPYHMQVGLTGKAISPRVYIPCGISGAIHHTCAIEGVGTIIAINPDKNARIFQHSDFGIISSFKGIPF